MKFFRRSLRENRIFLFVFLFVETFYLVDGRSIVQAYQIHQEKEQQLQEIAEFLDLPIQQLRPDHESLFETLQGFFIEAKDPVEEAGRARLQEVLRKHEEQLASNPYLPQIQAVENGHAIYRIEGAVNDLLQLIDPLSGKELSRSAQDAVLRGLHYGLRDAPKLPPLAEGLPAKAQQKHLEMQAKLDRLFDSVRPVIAASQEEKGVGTVAQKVEQLRLFQQGAERIVRSPRFAERPLPTQRLGKKASTLDVSKARAADPSLGQKISPTRQRSVEKSTIPSEITALATELDSSPAAIYRFVHDEIALDPKWGATKSPLGTLWERSGTSWDQAWLLQQLLTATGVDARFEWGEVEITTEQLLELTGVEDPWRAGDLVTTAGTPIVLLTEGSRVVAARLAHVWVLAHLDYVPNRGVTPGPGDTWIRMDPSLKRMEYTEGLPVHENVPFTLADYLTSGTPLSPLRYYEEALWDSIRANNIDCTNLTQLESAGSILPEAVPFVPGTLRAEILSLDGSATEIPESMQQQLTLRIRSDTGGDLLSWSAPWPAIYGQRVELAWPGATVDDQATLDSYGGVFETPPYLVDLAPSIRVNGVEVARGSAIGSAEDIETLASVSSPAIADTRVSFQGVAGERNVVALDFGTMAQETIDSHNAAIGAARSGGDAAAEEAATLALLGSQYLRNLSRDLADLSGWKQQRVVKLGTLGMVLQKGEVTTAVGGSPLTFAKGGMVVDIATMPLGVFSITGEDFGVESFELLGAQSSYLEGDIFNEVLADEGISAVAFLTRAVRAGQQLSRVDGNNLESVLALVDLGEDVETALRLGIQQGKIAWVSESQLTVNQWRGAGYILEDPTTGAAGYLATGGYGAGAATGDVAERANRLLGHEEWFGPAGDFFGWLESIFGFSQASEPSTIVSDPINLSSGNLIHQATDLQILARGLPLVWTRTYNSQSEYTGPFGKGWTFSYGEHLERQLDGTILYREHDGTEHLFELDNGTFRSPPGKHLELTENGSGYELKFKDGLRINFQSQGTMQSIVDRNGNTLTLLYGAEGLLSGVVDAVGRNLLTVRSEAGKITEIEDLTGRIVYYEYQGDLLKRVLDVGSKPWNYSYDGDARLVAVEDPLGHQDAFAYDSLGRCIRHVDKLGYEETFQYARQGAGATYTDRNGFRSHFEFDPRGRATRMADAYGNVMEATWDADNNRLSTTNPRGGTDTFTYDDRGNLLSETNALGETFKYTYEGTYNRLATEEDPFGHILTYGHDANGNVTSTSETVSGVEIQNLYGYNDAGQLTSMTDAEGNIRIFEYESEDTALENGIINKVTDPTGVVTQYRSDSLGRITEIEDGAGNTTTATYDGSGNLTHLDDTLGNAVQITYDELGRPLTSSDGTTTAEMIYDAGGRVVTSIDSSNRRTQYEYDAQGNLLIVQHPSGSRSRFINDPLGRAIAMVDAQENLWTMDYCQELGAPLALEGADTGRFCQLTDPLGGKVIQEFDELGRITTVTDPLGQTVRITADALNNIVSFRDADGKETLREFDERGNLTSITEANGAVTRYIYDRLGNRTSTIDAEGRVWEREYDFAGRVKKDINPEGGTSHMTYDAFGDLEAVTTARGQQLFLELERSQLKSIKNALGDELLSFDYDERHRRTGASTPGSELRFEYDDQGKIISVTDEVLSQSVSYEYDGEQRIQRRSTTSGSEIYIHNDLGILEEQQNSELGTFRFEYDALGRRTHLRYPNGTQTAYTYDKASQLLSAITQDSAGNVLDGFRYSYDSRGNLESERNLRSGRQKTYTYDETGKLTRWSRGEEFESYSYDLVGNRKTLEQPSGTTYYDYDDANRLVSKRKDSTDGSQTFEVYSWDSDGNLLSIARDGETLRTFVYDELSRLKSVNGNGLSKSYRYDALGLRTGEVNHQTGEERNFLYDYRSERGYEEVLEILDRDGNSIRYQASGPGVDDHLGAREGETSSYLHTGRLGSVSSVTNSEEEVTAEYDYSPFGIPLGSSVNDASFTGREYEDADLMYYRSRYYKPSDGRFVSRDPYSGDLHRPSSQNGFSYVENMPTRYVDPTGNYANIAVGLIYVGVGLLGLYGFYLFANREMEALGSVLKDPNIPTSEKGYRLHTSIPYVLGAMLVVAWFWGAYTIVGFSLIGRGVGNLLKSRAGAPLTSILSVNARQMAAPYLNTVNAMLACLFALSPFMSIVAGVSDPEIRIVWSAASIALALSTCHTAFLGINTITSQSVPFIA